MKPQSQATPLSEKPLDTPETDLEVAQTARVMGVKLFAAAAVDEEGAIGHDHPAVRV